jgi:hypothetical protein
MVRTACLVCLVCSVSGHLKNTLARASASSGHITKLEQSTFPSIHAQVIVNVYRGDKLAAQLCLLFWSSAVSLPLVMSFLPG